MLRRLRLSVTVCIVCMLGSWHESAVVSCR